MKSVTYEAGAGRRVGILDRDTVRGLAPGADLLRLVGAGAEVLADAGATARRAPNEVHELDEIRLLAPLPRPSSVRDGLCFLDHLRGCYRALGGSLELHPAWLQGPAFYFSNADAIVGPYDEVPVAPSSRMFDLELEVAAVIGRGGRDLDPTTAEDHIVGYTLFNDWTARDHQLRDLALGIGMGKAKDGATTLGPALVTVDELAEYRRDGCAAGRGRSLVRLLQDLLGMRGGESQARLVRADLCVHGVRDRPGSGRERRQESGCPRGGRHRRVAPGAA